MELYEKLQILRKKNGFSQEELAEQLGISRQAVSKWESGQSTPDLNKLVLLTELYNVTIDSLLKDKEELEQCKVKEDSEGKEVRICIKAYGYEYKSERCIFGLPLVHINVGLGLRKSKGIISIGNISSGVLSIGILSFGAVSLGLISLGLISLAIMSIGILLGIGVVSVGIFAVGAISMGVFSLGALAIGKYSIGAAAIASDIALGDYANANIAIGNNTIGVYELSSEVSFDKFLTLINSEYPNINNWVLKIFKLFIK